MRFSVAVCDDDMEFVKQINAMIAAYFQNVKNEYEIYNFNSGRRLLEACRNQSIPVIHLLFLDVEMGSMSGIEVKEQVSQMDIIKRLVFVTVHEEAMPMAFGMKVIGFITKPVSCERIGRWIQAVSEELKNNEIVYKSQNGQRVISDKDILYIKAEGDYTYLFRADSDEPEFTAHTMKYWEGLMKDPAFVRIHKSYLVNLEYVMQKKSSTIILKDKKTVLPIGRKYKKETEESYQSYLLGIIRRRIL